MTQNILIEFTADADGIEPGIQQLEQLGKVDKSLADNFNKTNSAIKQQAAALGSTDTALKTFTQNISKADKAAAGAFGTKVISDFEKNVAKTNLSSVKLVSTIKDLEKQQQKLSQAKANNALNAELVKKYSDALDETNGKLKELYTQLDELQASGKVFDEFGNEVEQNVEKVQTFKSRLRELKNELQQLESAGKDDTEAFRELSIEAARLEDQIGDTNQQIRILASDTFKFDALLGGVQGVTAAFGLAQSTTALFGAESEDLQKTLVKINAVMQISQSLQQLDNFLKGEGAAKEAVKIALQKISILNTQLETAATSESIVVRYAAAAAQKILNAAMAANPGVALLAIIAAIAGAILLFTSNTGDATEELKKFNDEFENGIKAIDDYSKALQASSQTKIAQLKKDNAAAATIREEEINATRLQLERVVKYQNDNRDNYLAALRVMGDKSKKLSKEQGEELQKFVDGYRNQGQQEFDLRQKLLESNINNEKASYNEGLKNATAFAESKVAIAIAGTRQELQAQIQAINVKKQEELNAAALLPGERALIEAESAAKIRSIRNTLRKLDLEDEKSVLQAKLDLSEKGTVQELEIKKQLAAKQLEIELNTLGLTSEKRKEYRAKEAAEQKELDKEIALTKIETQVSLNNAALSLVQEGTKDEFNLKLTALSLERDAAIVNAGNISSKKQEVEADYLKKVRELNKEYNYQVAQDALNIRIASLNTQIAPLEVQASANTNTKLLGLKKNLLEAQALLEIEGINNSEKNEQLRATRVAAVISKLSADKINLEKTTNAALIEQSKNFVQSDTKDRIQAEEQVLNSIRSSSRERYQAAKDITKLKKDLLDEEATALKQQLDANIISEEDYQLKIAELRRQANQLDYEETEKLEQKKKELRQRITEESFKLIQQISDAIFEADANQRQAQLDNALAALDTAKNKELDNKNLTEQQKADIEAKYKAREKKIKQEAAKKDREAQINQAIINGALAVTNILATMPKYDFGVASAIAIAASIATTAIQVAKIKSTPLPGLYRGTKDATEGIYRLGELGREMMVTKEGKLQMFGERREEIGYVPQGARVYSASETAEIMKFLPEMSMPKIELPTMAALPEWADAILSQNDILNTRIDYDQLGFSLAKHITAMQGKIADMPAVDVSIDENGISVIAQKGHNRTVYNNKRYSVR